MTEKNKWDPNTAIMVLQETFKDEIQLDRPLADLNTLGTGGRAKIYMEVTSGEELSRLLRVVNRLKVPFFMIGGGSNLLISDSGYDGLIIRNAIAGLEKRDEEIIAGAGENLQSLVDFATGSNLTGLEFASGIWGTVGGAIYGNAGAYGGDIGGVLVSAEIADRYGNIRAEKRDYFDFAYRSSRLKTTGEFVIRATFALKMGERETIQHRIDEIMAARKSRLPLNMRTAGCVFKNIPDNNEKFGKLAAGKLLEEIGAKNMRIGDARVSVEHANIIVNSGSASSNDIWKLVRLLKMKVKDNFGIELQEEIVRLGEFEEDCL